jgi:hypothetical protein
MIDIDFNLVISIAGAVITGALGPILVVKYKQNVFKNKDNQQKKEEFNSTVRNQNIINNSLNSIQEKYEIDRIMIMQFHNGGNFWPGNQSMKKMSVQYESTAPGISSHILALQNTPVSFFSGVLHNMLEDSKHAVFYTEKIKDNALRAFWESRGVGIVYIYPILGLDNLLLGLLIIEQTTSDSNLTVSTLNVLEDEAKRLSGYIQYNNVRLT